MNMRTSAFTTARNAMLETRSASSSSDDFATEQCHETGTSRWGMVVPLHGCELACTSSSCSSNYEDRVAGSSQEGHLVHALFSHDEALHNRKQTRAKEGEDSLVHILLLRHQSLRKRKERALQASQLSAPKQQMGDFVSPLVSPKKHDPSAYTDLYTAIDRSPGSPGSSCRSTPVSHHEAFNNRKQTRTKVGEDHLVHILLVRHESLRKRKERALQASQVGEPTQQIGDFVMSPLVSPKKHDPSAYTDLYTAIDRSPGSPGSSCRSQVAALGYKNHEFKKRDGNSITQLQADLLALFYECKNHGSIISPLMSRSSSPARYSSRVPSPCKNHVSISSPAISRSSSPARPTCQNDDEGESPLSSPKCLGKILQVYNCSQMMLL